MASGKCKNCDAAFGKGAEFCKICGQKIVDDAETEGPTLLTEAALDEIDKEFAETTPDGPVDVDITTATIDGDESEELFARLPEAEPTFTVAVVSGVNKGRIMRLRGEKPLLIGSGPDADIGLNDDCVSRRHAILEVKNGKLLVSDDGSTNGTFIRVGAPRELTSGDCFVLGGTVLRVKQEG